VLSLGVGLSVSLFHVLCCCVVGRLFNTVLFLCVDSSFCLLRARTAVCAVFTRLCALYHQESCDAMCHLVTAEAHRQQKKTADPIVPARGLPSLVFHHGTAAQLVGLAPGQQARRCRDSRVARKPVWYWRCCRGVAGKCMQAERAFSLRQHEMQAVACTCTYCVYMHRLRFGGAVQVNLTGMRCGVIGQAHLRPSICCRLARQEDSVLCICAAFIITTICLLDSPSAKP
jgi:hypothetical protein